MGISGVLSAMIKSTLGMLEDFMKNLVVTSTAACFGNIEVDEMKLQPLGRRAKKVCDEKSPPSVISPQLECF